MHTRCLTPCCVFVCLTPCCEFLSVALYSSSLLCIRLPYCVVSVFVSLGVCVPVCAKLYTHFYYWSLFFALSKTSFYLALSLALLCALFIVILCLLAVVVTYARMPVSAVAFTQICMQVTRPYGKLLLWPTQTTRPPSCAL